MWLVSSVRLLPPVRCSDSSANILTTGPVGGLTTLSDLTGLFLFRIMVQAINHTSNHHSSTPHIAIINPNTLAIIGLKSILQSVMPIMDIDCFGTFGELEASDHERYFHYFVSIDILIQHRTFFLQRRNKTIVITTSADSQTLSGDFNCLQVNQSEKQLIKDLLTLEQHAHAHGKNLPPAQQHQTDKTVLSQREIEVMTYIVRGYINKEIAEQLCIGLSTVITHRKNIMEKLNIRSVSALTIYAVTHGYVTIDQI